MKKMFVPADCLRGLTQTKVLEMRRKLRTGAEVLPTLLCKHHLVCGKGRERKGSLASTHLIEPIIIEDPPSKLS